LITINSAAAAPQANPDELTVHAMKKALDNPSLGIKVINVREADEYEIEKVDGVSLTRKLEQEKTEAMEKSNLCSLCLLL
jgi:hypothetical protein